MVTIKEEKLSNEMDLQIIKIKEDPEANPSVIADVFVNADCGPSEPQEELMNSPHEKINGINTEHPDMIIKKVKVEELEVENSGSVIYEVDDLNIKREPEASDIEIEEIVKCEIPAFSVTVEDFEKMGESVEVNTQECDELVIIRQDVGVGCNLDETDRSFFNHCPHCANFEKIIASLLKHDCIKKGNSQECVICNRISKTVQEMKSHLHIVHNNIVKPCNRPDHSFPFLCKLCNKTFESAYRLRVHKFIHGLIKSYKCRRCPKTFLKYESVVKHEPTHPDLVKFPRKDYNSMVYACTPCNLKYNSSEELKRHQEKHPSTFCRICEVSFATQKSYDFHVKQKHPKAKLSFICVKCRQVFSKAVTLQNHIQKMHRPS